MNLLTPMPANSGVKRLFDKSLYIAIFSLFGISLPAQSIIFNTPGITTWTVPAGANLISVEVWGGGGGGSKGFSSLKGTGGGGGGYASGSLFVHPGDVLTITVGAGGAGATASGNGSDGGNSIVIFSSNILIAYGGGGAKSDNIPSGTGGTGGAGSFSGAWTSTFSYCGGFGANLTSPTSSTPGGGAGGGAGQSGNGKNAGNSTSNCSSPGGGPAGGSATGNGGAGGSGGVNNSNGIPGSSFGGGGGGNAGFGVAGNGANGVVNIFYALALPVEMSYFKATSENCSTQLDWATASEEKFSHFEVERSLDGRNFVHLEDVPNKSNPAGSNYMFLEKSHISDAYYRLKMVDLDGSFVYSNIVQSVSKCNERQIVIYPNPVQYGQGFNIDINGYESDENEKVKGELIAPTGVVAKVFDFSEGNNQLPLNGLPPASYWLRVVDGNGVPTYQKLVVLK